MTDPHCLLCSGACPIPDCRFALRRDERPGTDEDELGAAHELMGDEE